MHVIDADTLLAAHIATPVEDAVTFLLPLLPSSWCGAAAAEQVTTVDAVGGDIPSPVLVPKEPVSGLGSQKLGEFS